MEQRLITVTRTESESLPADTVDISVTAVGEAKKYADAVDRAESAARAVTDALADASFAVRSSGVNVSAVRRDGKITGFSASRGFTLSFAYDKDNMAAALGALSGSECSWTVSFSLSDKSAAKKLLARAVEGAREDAQTIADAAGASLGALVKAEYRSEDGGRPMLMRAFAADPSSAAEPESITLTRSVECSWAIE